MTVTTAAPRTVVEPLPRTPLPFGLFSALSFRPPGDGRWENGVAWDSITCDPAGGIGYDAQDPPSSAGLPKTIDGSPATALGTPMTIYGHFQCSPAAYSPADAQDKARQHLLAREEARVEQAFWTGDLGTTPTLRGATLLDPIKRAPFLGMALLENAIASDYGSVGMIHVSRGVALWLAATDQITVTGSRLYTKIGTPVVAGAGYDGTGPGGEVPAMGESYAYATPMITGWRSDVFDSTNRPGDLLDRSTNDMLAVAERTYVLAHDPCGAAAVLLAHQ